MKHKALNAAILVLVFAGGVAAQSPEIEELLAAAEQGDPDAQYKLGLKYAFSAIDAARALLPYDYQKALIYTEDYQEAVKWYRLAAEQGHNMAQHTLGLAYDKGAGVPQDYQEAVKWYRLAAEQGNDASQWILGGMYDKGEGVPQDYQEAVKWYRLAAEQGKYVAQFELGAMYANGKGVPQDFVQAHKWINLAASQNTAHRWFSSDTATAESYRSWRDEVAERMTAKQIAEAQRLAREWQPKTWEQLKDE